MAKKHKSLFLFLALACFLGIILIFIFDGYMGLYDSITMTSGEIPTKVEASQWQEQDRYGFMPSMSIGYGEKGTFSYEIQNRRFTSYNTEINVSLWRNQEKAADILTETINIKSFSSSQFDWTFDTTVYIPGGLTANASDQYTIIIKHGKIERKLLVYVFSKADQSGIKIIPPPTQ